MSTHPLASIQFDALLSCAIEVLVSLLVYWLKNTQRQDFNMRGQKVGSLAELSPDEDTARRLAIRRSRWDDSSRKSDLSMRRHHSTSEIVRSDTCVNNKFLNGWILVEKLAMKISSSQLNFFMHSFREVWCSSLGRGDDLTCVQRSLTNVSTLM